MKNTLHLNAQDPTDIERAADLLRAGRLVAFPTETVYGLGAHALNPSAVASIFAAKGRPAWDPLIVHVASRTQLPEIAETGAALSRRVDALAAKFWPGPLTLLLPRTAAVPDAVTAGRPLVGVRLPAHPVARQLLRAAGIPVAAPSANLFGHTSPTCAEHVLADLDGRIDAVLDGGQAEVGVESTVLDPATMTLYRPGAISPEALAAAADSLVTVFQPSSEALEPQALPSPGVGIRHYAPRARLVLVEPAADLKHSLRGATEAERSAGRKPGLMLPEGWAGSVGVLAFQWGTWEDPAALAHNLFAGLRWLDTQGVETILAPLPPRGGLYDALRDRLQKAARPA